MTEFKKKAHPRSADQQAAECILGIPPGEVHPPTNPDTLTNPTDSYQMSTNPDIIGDVTLFMEIMGQDLPTVPAFPSQGIRELRIDLDTSEFQELCDAEGENDLLGVADGVVDLMVTLTGRANAYGIPLAACWREVQRANLAKLWTLENVQSSLNHPDKAKWTATPIPPSIYERYPQLKGLFVVKSEIGKVQKPPGWQAPDIKSAVYQLESRRKDESLQPAVESPSSRRRDEAHPNLPVPGKADPISPSETAHPVPRSEPNRDEPCPKPSLSPHKDDPSGPAPPPNFNTPGRDR